MILTVYEFNKAQPIYSYKQTFDAGEVKVFYLGQNKVYLSDQYFDGKRDIVFDL